MPYLARQMEWLRRHAGPALAAGAYVPQLAPELVGLGEYQRSDLAEAIYLTRNSLAAHWGLLPLGAC